MLALENISKNFDNASVLSDISLEIEQGEILCLLGASGCGKTTLLRIIGGLEQAESGTLLQDAQPIQNIPPHQRGFGLMFQDFALFPHMTVAQNVAFGLQMAKQNRQAQQERVKAVLSLVGLDAFAQRDVTALSGGEQQRVALARSLAPNPTLLMLDEPLGSLDAALRERLVVDLRRILKDAGVTAIYVTHDQSEAYAIADRIAVMDAGKIEQIASPETLYLCPQTGVVAQFLGLHNILPVQTCQKSQEGFLLQTDLGKIPLDSSTLTETCDQVLLHPAFLSLDDDGVFQFEATVQNLIFKGGMYQLNLITQNGTKLIMYLPTRSASLALPKAEQRLTISVAQGGVLPLRA